MQKICIKCGAEKDINEFSKQSSNKDGYKNKCKQCVNDYGKEYRNNNIEYELQRSKLYYENNKDKRLEYFHGKKDDLIEYGKDYRVKNKESISKKRKDNYIINKEKIVKQSYESYKRRLINDPIFRLKVKIKSTIRSSIRSRGYLKKDRTIDILGCSVNDFKIYLESKFEPWMTWVNYGKYNGEMNYGWDIDHIIKSSCATTEEELIKLNHYLNLQPLCSKINRDVKR